MRLRSVVAIILVFVLALCLSSCTDGRAKELSGENREFVIAVGYAFDDLYEVRRLKVPTDETDFPDFASRTRASVESAWSRVERYLSEPTAAQAPVAERVRFGLTSMRGAVEAFERSMVNPTPAGLADVKVGFSEGRTALLEAAMLLKPVAPSRLGRSPEETSFIMTTDDCRIAADRLQRLLSRRVAELGDDDENVEIEDLPVEVLALATLAAVMEMHADGKPN